ncbi:5-hydroxyisourate hydrolase [Evansella caseinilytica]|uniref:5-hydroxyisourate hydrolase n=1 Tax=Evansella caseinilytica TaxID=1503961 RepID=A0A1H3HTE0_9BACI|nr:hydroxyisourate hydrolase [Evansella caseinilytica]SDY18680.1 5-hydroxyisourate hydrolase [Evansella caseinilytica]
MAGRLTTHVLNTSAGKPAQQLFLELWKYNDSTQQVTKILECRTNEDGRVNRPLLEGERMAAGQYELRFFVDEYFRSTGAQQEELPFLQIIPVRFTISDTEVHYHIPLLVAPGGYTVYRGS